MKPSLTAFLLIWGILSSGCEKQKSDHKTIDMTSSQDGMPQLISEFDQEEAEIQNLGLIINDVEWLSYESNLITIFDEYHVREIIRHLPELVGIDEQIPASISNLEAKISISLTDSIGNDDMVILYIDKEFKLSECNASESVVSQINVWLNKLRISIDHIRRESSNTKSSSNSD